MDKDQMWETLTTLGVDEQTLQIVTCLNGYSTEVMTDILYAHTGLRSFEQIG